MLRAVRLLACASLVTAMACSATKLIGEWRAPNYDGPPMKKVLVCGVHPDETTRRIFEDTFAQKLQERGVEALTCYSVLKGNDRPTEPELRAAVAEANVDGVILTRLARVAERTTYTPGYYAASPFFYAGPFYPAYYTSVGFAYSPGYYSTDTIVQLLTQVYENKNNGELVWSATSQTTDPESAKGLVKSVVPKFMNALTDAGILPKEKQKS